MVRRFACSARATSSAGTGSPVTSTDSGTWAGRPIAPEQRAHRRSFADQEDTIGDVEVGIGQQRIAALRAAAARATNATNWRRGRTADRGIRAHAAERAGSAGDVGMHGRHRRNPGCAASAFNRAVANRCRRAYCVGDGRCTSFFEHVARGSALRQRRRTEFYQSIAQRGRQHKKPAQSSSTRYVRAQPSTIPVRRAVRWQWIGSSRVNTVWARPFASEPAMLAAPPAIRRARGQPACIGAAAHQQRGACSASSGGMP